MLRFPIDAVLPEMLGYFFVRFGIGPWRGGCSGRILGSISTNSINSMARTTASRVLAFALLAVTAIYNWVVAIRSIKLPSDPDSTSRLTAGFAAKSQGLEVVSSYPAPKSVYNSLLIG